MIKKMFGILLIILSFTYCTETVFGGKGNSKSADPKVPPEVTSVGTNQPLPEKSPMTSPTEVNVSCTQDYKALRMAFVVDNSGSHGVSVLDPSFVAQNPDPSVLPTRLGSDPVLFRKSIRQNQERVTLRQEAIYDVISNVLNSDQAAIKSKPSFIGSSLSIAYFPKDTSWDGFGQFVPLFGTSPQREGFAFPSGYKFSFPSKSVNLSKISNQTDFLAKFWEDLTFTHYSAGGTPYSTALEAAKESLDATSIDSSDNRDKIIFFITDGLPNDTRPSKILEKKQLLGNAKLILISLLKPFNPELVKSSPVYLNLKGQFENPATLWGNSPGNSDGFSNFDEYWNKLASMPRTIANEYYEVDDIGKLRESLLTILKEQQTCSKTF